MITLWFCIAVRWELDYFVPHLRSLRTSKRIMLLWLLGVGVVGYTLDV
jgi:hypothetical protein